MPSIIGSGKWAEMSQSYEKEFPNLFNSMLFDAGSILRIRPIYPLQARKSY